MRYAIQCQDAGVTVMTLVPISIDIDGRVLPILDING